MGITLDMLLIIVNGGVFSNNACNLLRRKALFMTALQNNRIYFIKGKWSQISTSSLVKNPVVMLHALQYYLVEWCYSEDIIQRIMSIRYPKSKDVVLRESVLSLGTCGFLHAIVTRFKSRKYGYASIDLAGQPVRGNSILNAVSCPLCFQPLSSYPLIFPRFC